MDYADYVDYQLRLAPYSDPYRIYDPSNVFCERPEFFISHKITINGKLLFFSSYADRLLEFDGFNIRLVMNIQNYQNDRHYNKVAVVRNQLYFTNGSDVFHVRFGPRYL